MSFWARARAALGFPLSTGDVALEDDRLVLRELERARAFPQEAGELGRADIAACERCGKWVRKVVFTTAGEGAQVAIWKQYPLAMDGWLCVSCGWAAAPRVISVEESVAYGRAGSGHASAGRFDDAEFWFRRIIGSWSGYAAGYADLGQLAVARANASKNPEEKWRYRNEAVSWLRRAVDADREVRLAPVRITFARALALVGNENEALALLASLRESPAFDATMHAEGEKLAHEIASGRALFTRASDLIGTLALAPPSKPLLPSERQALEAGRALLLEACGREASFASCWFLGKVELRLRNLDAALVAMQTAHSSQPDQPDGCRELASIYLELGRAEDALPVTYRAVQLCPADAGLRCNLALVLLLTGNVPAAHAEASAALSADPNDTITRALLKMIDDVIAGRRACPRSLAEAEGRARPMPTR